MRDQVIDDRRLEPKRFAPDQCGIVSARVRPGIEICLIDVSCSGASIETEHRLPPGRRLDLQLSFALATVVVPASVVRCAVCQALADRIRYRIDLRFDHAVHWPIDAGGVERPA